MDDKWLLDRFFSRLRDFYEWYRESIGRDPKWLIMSPVTLQKLSRMEGFFQRPELGTEVTLYAPVVRRLKVTPEVVVEIVEDPIEPFLHFE